MSLFNRTLVLLATAEAINTDQTGKSYAVLPTQDEDLAFRAFVDVKQTGGNGSPTTTVFLETSHDGDWIPVITPITLNSDDEEHKFLEITALGPLVRARTVLGGSTKPSHEVTVKLASDGDFRLKERHASHNTTSDAGGGSPTVGGPGGG